MLTFNAFLSTIGNISEVRIVKYRIADFYRPSKNPRTLGATRVWNNLQPNNLSFKPQAHGALLFPGLFPCQQDFQVVRDRLRPLAVAHE
jgi:hypothetical protein